MILVNTDYISGKNLEMLGLVKGSTIQSKNIGKDITQGFKTLVGGELKAYNEMMNEARALATKRMVEKAKSDKAYVGQLFREFEQTATTNLTAKKISGLTNRLIKGTQKGFFEIKGTSKIGKALGDGIDHAEFYPDKESIIDVTTKIYGLKKRE